MKMERKVSEYERKETDREKVIQEERRLNECCIASRWFPNNEILKTARNIQDRKASRERRRFLKKYKEDPTKEVETCQGLFPRWKLKSEDGFVVIEYSGFYDSQFLMLFDYDLDDLIDYIEQFKEAGF